MPETMTDKVKRANQITALTVSTSKITQALVAIRMQIPLHRSHPAIGALTSQRDELETELLWLNNEFNALIAGQGTIPAPSNAQIDEIAALARQVDELILGAETADAVLSAANKAIALANKIKAG